MIPSRCYPCCLALALLCRTNGAKTNNRSPSKVFRKGYVQKLLANSDLPPIELDMQLDFEIAPTTGATGSGKRRNTREAAKPKRKNVTKNYSKLVVSPTTKSPPFSKKTSRNFHGDFAEVRRRIKTASESIFEHKYAGILWASLLIVWAPLLSIFIVNRWMGKEAFIDFLVRVLPEGFPARYIEMVIEDALWVGIFGVSIVATLGTFLVEMATLGIDIGRTLSQDSRLKNNVKQWK